MTYDKKPIIKNEYRDKKRVEIRSPIIINVGARYPSCVFEILTFGGLRRVWHKRIVKHPRWIVERQYIDAEEGFYEIVQWETWNEQDQGAP